VDEMVAAGLVRELVHGRWKGQALAGALRLGVPAALADEPRTAPQVAAELGTDPDGTERLLRLLACVGVLSVAGGRYVLADAARRLLPEHPTTVARDAAFTLSAPVCGAWSRLAEAVRTGRPVAPGGYPADDPVVAAYRAGVAEKNLAALLTQVDVPETGAVVVAGSANQPMLSALRQHRPRLSGALLVPGEPVPPADLYLLPHVLHDLPDPAALALLGDLAAAMTSDSLLVVLAAAATASDTPPLAAYLDVQQLLVSDSGRERTDAEHAALLTAAGLVPGGVADLAGRPGIRLHRARLA
jgi:hypothetical protein